MILLLYRLGLRLYAGFAWCAAFFSTKAMHFVKGRKHWREQLRSKIAGIPAENRVWFHCASLGEFEQARPLIEHIKTRYNYPVIVSFFSPSGYEIRKHYAYADVVCYLPLDSRRNARDFTGIINPSRVFFVKYEFWYYYLHTLFSRKIPTYLVSAVFRPDQLFFKTYGRMFFDLLKGFETIFVQNEASLNLLRQKGIHNALKSGDTRYDRVMQTYRQTHSDNILEQFSSGYNTLILGSSWPEEEQVTAEWLTSATHAKLRIIIAPHDISAQHTDAIEKQFASYHPLRYSSAADIVFQPENKILIMDTIGHLAAAYRYGNIAFVGGAFGKGLHNILEPAVFGMPVIFGPAPEKFPEAAQAVASGFGFRINHTADFSGVIETLLNDSVYYEDCCKAAHAFVASHTGATDLIVAECFRHESAAG